jgi:hypothetical protein
MSDQNTKRYSPPETADASQNCSQPDYYKVTIIETSAQLFSSDYSAFNVERKHFATLAEVKAWLKEHYGKAKRSKMYCEPNGEQCGYIYKFRNADRSHAPVETWNQCDWVSISAISEQRVILTQQK